MDAQPAPAPDQVDKGRFIGGAKGPGDVVVLEDSDLHAVFRAGIAEVVFPEFFSDLGRDQKHPSGLQMPAGRADRGLEVRQCRHVVDGIGNGHGIEALLQIDAPHVAVQIGDLWIGRPGEPEHFFTDVHSGHCEVLLECPVIASRPAA